jgi:hypothetical protein
MQPHGTLVVRLWMMDDGCLLMLHVDVILSCFFELMDVKCFHFFIFTILVMNFTWEYASNVNLPQLFFLRTDSYCWEIWLCCWLRGVAVCVVQPHLIFLLCALHLKYY